MAETPGQFSTEINSIDLGTNSLGWCVLETNGEPGAGDVGGNLGVGARVFPDGREPKSGMSLAVERRMARAMRGCNCCLRRRKALLAALTEFRLMPSDHETHEKPLAQTLNGSGGDAPEPPLDQAAELLKNL